MAHYRYNSQQPFLLLHMELNYTKHSGRKQAERYLKY